MQATVLSADSVLGCWEAQHNRLQLGGEENIISHLGSDPEKKNNSKLINLVAPIFKTRFANTLPRVTLIFMFIGNVE